MKDYKIGFSIKSFIAFLAVMLPNIIWMIYPPTNDMLTKNTSNFVVLNILQAVSQSMMIAILIILYRRTTIQRNVDKFYIAGCFVCLGLYYFFWICYYIGTVSPIMFFGDGCFSL